MLTPYASSPPYVFFTQVPGCVLYLDARDPSNNGTQPSNNASIAEWYDKSGNGNNLSHATGAKQPTFISSHFNGQSALYFDGSQGFLGSSIPICSSPVGSWTIYYVIDLSGISTEQFITDSPGNVSRFLFYNNSSQWIWNATGAIGTSQTGKQVLTFVLSTGANTVTAYINGVSIGSVAYVANAPATSLSLGFDYGQSFDPITMYCGAHLWYNWAHDSTTRGKVETRLGNIFGIAAT